MSKPTQLPPPRFKIRPRGVRFGLGKSEPALPPSSTDEKNGKSDSTHELQGVAIAGLRVCGAAAWRVETDTSEHITATVGSATAVRQARNDVLDDRVTCENTNRNRRRA